MRNVPFRCSLAATALALGACGGGTPQQEQSSMPTPSAAATAASDTAAPDPTIAERLAQYTTVRLTTDVAQLGEAERRMIPLLIAAAQAMDTIYWDQAYGRRDSLLRALDDPGLERYVGINYGPWDRLAGNAPFVPGVGPKPKGANFYPHDMTADELTAAAARAPDGGTALKSLYTLVRRAPDGGLRTVPYHEAYAAQVRLAAARLREAAALAENPELRRYLELRATALETDDYGASDRAWLDMKTNTLDVVIGPIETYEDALFGYKAANEAFVLVKDQEWSRRLARYVTFLPALQRGLPVAEAYKQEEPGSDSELNAYDAVYYAGDANAGSKTIAINLPNDEQVQLEKGTRRLQLKNAMRAKFDRIMLPIAAELIVEDQRKHVTFDAFFANTMFHEVAHGLGIKNTVKGAGGTVREALKEQAGALEEGKADVLGLYMVTSLHEQGELTDLALEDAYTTFLAGIFRSVRFGASSAHGRANAARFTFFQEMGAFQRDPASGRYRVDVVKMREAMNALSERILVFQGDGDYAGVKAFTEEKGRISPQLQADLERLGAKGIPVDVVFEQGVEVLGL